MSITTNVSLATTSGGTSTGADGMVPEDGVGLEERLANPDLPPARPTETFTPKRGGDKMKTAKQHGTADAIAL